MSDESALTGLRSPGGPSDDGNNAGGEFSQRACDQLAILIRGLVECLHRFQNVQPEVLVNSEDAESLLEELKTQLQQARQLVDISSELHWLYKVINAFQIRTEFRNVCHSLGLTLEGLHSLLSPSMSQLRDELKKLEWAFRNAMFPLDRKELQMFKSAKQISCRIRDKEVTPMEGIAQLRQALDDIVGVEQVEAEWKEVAEQLCQDLDSARVRKDKNEETYLRQLFWALAGPDKPPPDFYCPISLEIMEDPVLLVETAVTYDRNSIDTWFYAYGAKRCPVSGKMLTEKLYVENRPLRSLIDDWKRTHKRKKEAVKDGANGSTSSQSWAVDQASASSVWQSAEHPIGPGSFDTITEDDTAKEGTSVDLPAELDSHEVVADAGEVRSRLARRESWRSSSSGHSRRRRISNQSFMKEMLAAAQSGDLEAIAESVRDGWNMDNGDERGRTCLHVAAAFGQIDVVQFLLENEAPLNTRTLGDGATPLFMASVAGHADAVQMLLSASADHMLVNQYGWTPLHGAADSGRLEVVKVLLGHAATHDEKYISMKSTAGWTAMHHAARCGSVEVMRELVPYFDNVNEKSEAGWTALHVAVDNSHKDAIKFLLAETNANPNIQSSDGWTALHAAQDKNDVEMGRLLLEYGADPDIQGAEGVTALHRAAFLNHRAFAKLLVTDGKADLQRKTKAGRKAIQIASEYSYHELYNFLFKKGLQRVFKGRGG